MVNRSWLFTHISLRSRGILMVTVCLPSLSVSPASMLGAIPAARLSIAAHGKIFSNVPRRPWNNFLGSLSVLLSTSPSKKKKKHLKNLLKMMWDLHGIKWHENSIQRFQTPYVGQKNANLKISPRPWPPESKKPGNPSGQVREKLHKLQLHNLKERQPQRWPQRDQDNKNLAVQVLQLISRNLQIVQISALPL